VSVVRASPSRTTWKTSSAKLAAVAESSAPEYAATAPYQAAGSEDEPSGRFEDFWAAASSAAPPATLVAGSSRRALADRPLTSAARSSVVSEAGRSEVAGAAALALVTSGRTESPRASSPPSPVWG
jgi:hypothetical protein